MLGAIIGDIIGSRFEWDNIKSKDFDLFTKESDFTDDTVMTIAVAAAILHGEEYGDVLHRFGNAYPDRGYGGRFFEWLAAEYPGGSYGSYGNGSAMRVSPTAYISDDLDRVLAEARRSAVVTHDHAEGIKGAEATAMAMFLARTGKSKSDIQQAIQSAFGYDLTLRLDVIRPGYCFDETCQGTVPQAISAFLESESYEDAIRNAISLGGDSDTLACITGGIAEAFYGGVPGDIREQALQYLPEEFRRIVAEFEVRYYKSGL